MTDLAKILKDMIAQYGESVLSDQKRVNSVFSDLARDVPKAKKNALLKCIEHGFAKVLQETAEAEKIERKQQLAQKLHEEEGFALDLCTEALDLLELALAKKEKKRKKKEKEKLLCPNCKKELQEDWKVCPFCSTGTTSQEEPPKVSSAISPNARIIPPPPPNNVSNDDTDKLKKKLKKTKIGLIVAIVIGVVGMAVMGFVIYEERSWNNYLWDDRRTLQNNYNTLQRNHEQAVPKIINVASLRVGNWSGREWINNPGTNLLASQMRYLAPDINYNSVINEEITFFFKLFAPNGTLLANSNSPSGFTFSQTRQVNRGNNQYIAFSVWGDSERSIFQAGEYTIEVWYSGVRLISEKITINP